jgi:DNA-binding transcriptional ArsR family regulator
MVKCLLDATAAAIASAPRRAIVDRLADAPASMSELADQLDLTMPAIDKHLKVLVGAGLVERAKQGRTTSYTLNPGSLQELATWAMSRRLMWAAMLDRYATTVEEPTP